MNHINDECLRTCKIYDFNTNLHPDVNHRIPSNDDLKLCRDKIKTIESYLRGDDSITSKLLFKIADGYNRMCREFFKKSDYHYAIYLVGSRIDKSRTKPCSDIDLNIVPLDDTFNDCWHLVPEMCYFVSRYIKPPSFIDVLVGALDEGKPAKLLLEVKDKNML